MASRLRPVGSPNASIGGKQSFLRSAWKNTKIAALGVGLIGVLAVGKATGVLNHPKNRLTLEEQKIASTISGRTRIPEERVIKTLKILKKPNNTRWTIENKRDYHLKRAEYWERRGNTEKAEANKREAERMGRILKIIEERKKLRQEKSQRENRREQTQRENRREQTQRENRFRGRGSPVQKKRPDMKDNPGFKKKKHDDGRKPSRIKRPVKKLKRGRGRMMLANK